MYGGQKTWATFYFFIPALTIHLQGTWRKPSFSCTPQGKHLSFPVHFLLPASVTQDFPSVTQRRLGRFQQTVSLAAGSGRYAGFPCSAAPAAIPSPARERHSFLPTPFTAWDTPAAPVSGSALLPESLPGSPHTCLGCCETRTRRLNINYTGLARLQLECENAFPHLFAASPGIAQAGQ